VKGIQGLPDLSLSGIRSPRARATGTCDVAAATALGKAEELTPESTPKAFSGRNRLSAIGRRRTETAAGRDSDNPLQKSNLGKENRPLATAGKGEEEMGREGRWAPGLECALKSIGQGRIAAAPLARSHRYSPNRELDGIEPDGVGLTGLFLPPGVRPRESMRAGLDRIRLLRPVLRTTPIFLQ